MSFLYNDLNLLYLSFIVRACVRPAWEPEKFWNALKYKWKTQVYFTEAFILFKRKNKQTKTQVLVNIFHNKIPGSSIISGNLHTGTDLFHEFLKNKNKTKDFLDMFIWENMESNVNNRVFKLLWFSFIYIWIIWFTFEQKKHVVPPRGIHKLMNLNFWQLKYPELCLLFLTECLGIKICLKGVLYNSVLSAGQCSIS